MPSLIWRIVNRSSTEWRLCRFRLRRLVRRYARGGSRRIWLFGAPGYINLGDHAQTLCLLGWFRRFYPGYGVHDLTTHELMSHDRFLLRELAPLIGRDDLIFFQSGYNTTDMYPAQEEMHRAVVRLFPDRPIVFMPQTVSFRPPYGENRFVRESAELYRECRRLLLLCRDPKSLEIARAVFPGVKTELFPDPVTMMIGTRRWDAPRKGILLCLRDDSEKAIDEGELARMTERLRRSEPVRRIDTSIGWPPGYFIVENRAKYVDAMLGSFAAHRLVITDRYHGVIFALVTGTPVIVLKTRDHKLTGGISFFEDDFGDLVRLADSPASACAMAESGELRPRGDLPDLFNTRYYNHLKELIDASFANR